MHKFAIIYYSRSNSVQKLAIEISKGIQSVNNNSDIKLICCTDAKNSMNEINTADAIIFGSPTYFGSLASEMKAFFDYTGQIFIERKWKNKIAAGFTHSSSLSGDKFLTLTQIMTFAMQQGMIWIGQDSLANEFIEVPQEWSDLGDEKLEVNNLGSWIGLMSQSNSMKGIEISKNDLFSARLFGRRIGMITTIQNKHCN